MIGLQNMHTVGNNTKIPSLILLENLMTNYNKTE